MTADNVVKGVKLMHENGLTEDLAIQYEGEARWEDKKTIAFQQSHINEQAALMIHAEDGEVSQDYCTSAGLVVHCIASDTRSQWDNFVTNTNDWYSEDGKELCSNNDASFLKFNVDWITDLMANGANHIWVEGNQVANLVGSPWNDFAVVSGMCL